MIIVLLEGEKYTDERGQILHNNDFDLSEIRRLYVIENIDIDYYRGWKGHLIEKRWFLCVKGKIKLYVSSIDNLNNRIQIPDSYELDENQLNVIYIPPGNATLIKQLSPGSRLMVFSDWSIAESNDENLRWPNNILEL